MLFFSLSLEIEYFDFLDSFSLLDLVSAETDKLSGLDRGVR